ncbi:MAG: agmatinase [Clostridia bacterium]|nr:agmatinase [Clostridia bacterium]
MIKPNIETFIGCEADFDEATTVIFGAPFDSTVSYRPGSRFGPAAIRHESYGIEIYSPYQDKELEDFKICDSGDIELPFGAPDTALDMITERSREIAGNGKIPVMLGGEHLVTLGQLRALNDKYPKIHVIQFDAHSDLRDDYLGVKLSHACVMRRAFELSNVEMIHQFCIRSGEKTEFEFASENTDMHKFNSEGLDEVVNQLSDGTPVYLTIDLDCLDPSCMPGTGTPEAGGINFTELLNAVVKIGKLNIIGADINELAPNLDTSGQSTALACKLLRELLIAIQK